MAKITTSSGFVCEVDEESINDAFFFDDVRKMKRGDLTAMVDLCERLLGESGKDELLGHLKDDKGRAPMEDLEREITEIIQELKSVKK